MDRFRAARSFAPIFAPVLLLRTAPIGAAEPAPALTCPEPGYVEVHYPTASPLPAAAFFRIVDVTGWGAERGMSPAFRAIRLEPGSTGPVIALGLASATPRALAIEETMGSPRAASGWRRLGVVAELGDLPAGALVWILDRASDTASGAEWQQVAELVAGGDVRQWIDPRPPAERQYRIAIELPGGAHAILHPETGGVIGPTAPNSPIAGVTLEFPPRALDVVSLAVLNPPSRPSPLDALGPHEVLLDVIPLAGGPGRHPLSPGGEAGAATLILPYAGLAKALFDSAAFWLRKQPAEVAPGCEWSWNLEDWWQVWPELREKRLRIPVAAVSQTVGWGSAAAAEIGAAYLQEPRLVACPEDRLSPFEAGTCARNLLLVHGLFAGRAAFAAPGRYGGPPDFAVGLIDWALDTQGYDHVLVYEYPSARPVQENAAALVRLMDERADLVPPGARFDIVAHSAGGLVARAYLELAPGRRVHRLVTVATPHAGAAAKTVAEWFVAGTVPGQEEPLELGLLRGGAGAWTQELLEALAPGAADCIAGSALLAWLAAAADTTPTYTISGDVAGGLACLVSSGGDCWFTTAQTSLPGGHPGAAGQAVLRGGAFDHAGLLWDLRVPSLPSSPVPSTLDDALGSWLAGTPDCEYPGLFSVTGFLRVYGCTSVDLSPDGGILYARTLFGGAIPTGFLAIDAATREIVRAYRLPEAEAYWSGQLSADGTALWTAEGGQELEAEVRKIDLGTGQIVARVVVGKYLDAVAFSPGRRYLYVGENDENGQRIGSIQVVDTVTEALVASIPLNGEPGACLPISPDGEFLYLTTRNAGTERLYKIALADHTVRGTLDLPGIGEGGLSLSPDGATVYVADGKAGLIRLVDALSLQERGAWPSVKPEGCFASPFSNHVLVTSSRRRIVEVLRASDGALVQAIGPLRGGASGGWNRTPAWDPADKTAYLPLPNEWVLCLALQD